MRDWQPWMRCCAWAFMRRAAAHWRSSSVILARGRAGSRRALASSADKDAASLRLPDRSLASGASGWPAPVAGDGSLDHLTLSVQRGALVPPVANLPGQGGFTLAKSQPIDRSHGPECQQLPAMSLSPGFTTGGDKLGAGCQPVSDQRAMSWNHGWPSSSLSSLLSSSRRAAGLQVATSWSWMYCWPE